MDQPKVLSSRSSWGNSNGPGDRQGDFGPSIVEPVHNLSLEDLVRDYSLGILHPQSPALYDEGEDISPVDPIEDFVDLIPNSDFGSAPAGEDFVPEKETPPDLPDSAPDSPE